MFYQLLLAVKYLQEYVTRMRMVGPCPTCADARDAAAASLSSAPRRGIAHRDLKLENVLLSSSADDALVKVRQRKEGAAARGAWLSPMPRSASDLIFFFWK